MKRGQRIVIVLAVAGIAALAVMQLIPMARTNPPMASDIAGAKAGDIVAPPQIEGTLRRACYDCHSNETRWPWYSGIAPVSWLIAHDVDLGRKEIDFSEWQNYYPQTRRHKLEWMGRALQEEVMPPWPYRLMHPGARLSNEERAALEQWVKAEAARLQGERRR
jgi:Haem-binding domain